jgi:hypothetical protein
VADSEHDELAIKQDCVLEDEEDASSRAPLDVIKESLITKSCPNIPSQALSLNSLWNSKSSFADTNSSVRSNLTLGSGDSAILRRTLKRVADSEHTELVIKKKRDYVLEDEETLSVGSNSSSTAPLIEQSRETKSCPNLPSLSLKSEVNSNASNANTNSSVPSNLTLDSEIKATMTPLAPLSRALKRVADSEHAEQKR